MNIFFKKPGKSSLLFPIFRGKFIAFIVFILISVSLCGQSLPQLELDYQNLTRKIHKKRSELDSLNTVHNKMVSAIDEEKQKKTADENKIKEMLASAVVVSNKIKERQTKLDKIEADLESVKTDLDRKYAAKIDSIKNLEKSVNNSGEKESLKSLKLKYIEKRLIVAPRIYSLSFDPEKLIQYKQPLNDDSLFKKIYLEYLSNALEEVNQQSQQIAYLKDEIEEVVNLQNETKDFLEDVDSELLINPARRSSEKSARTSNAFSGEYPYALDESSINFYSQANSYLHIFYQLKNSTNIDLQTPWPTPTDTIPANLTVRQYLKLLENVDKMLQNYKTILEHKMESN